MDTPRLTLIAREGCHLCDDAREVVSEVLAQYPSVTLTELSVDDDPALLAEYSDKVPVLLVNGERHSMWRVKPERLRKSLDELA